MVYFYLLLESIEYLMLMISPTTFLTKDYYIFFLFLLDDNNTRVLFERVLSAETLPPKDAR